MRQPAMPMSIRADSKTALEASSDQESLNHQAVLGRTENLAKRYVQYRAPAESGQIFCDPAWGTLDERLAANSKLRANASHEIFGRSLVDLAKEARKSVLQSALAYTRSYADVDDPPSSSTPLVIAGHQPELVHTGVWLKNFAAAKLASRSGGIAINLVIDNDLCRSPSIRIPTGTIEHPRVETVAYDQISEELPFEERQIEDRSLWKSFGKRAADTLKPLIADPLIASWWRETVLSHNSSHLGTAIAQARHRTELDWGCKSLEIPQSLVCQTTPFRWFAVHLLANAAKVRSSYNDALAEYRHAHHLRNHAQPLPDLTEVDRWIETPFWIWTADNPQRRILFVQCKNSELLLTDLSDFAATLPISSESDPMRAIEQLATWEGQGIKLRTRALATTMYARLLLADLFIHGIGGAKYDQVTDAICNRLFGFAPSPYATLSGTLRLPINHQPFSIRSQSELRTELREIAYHPEVEIAKLSLDKSDQSKVDALKRKKSDWVHTTQTPKNAAERHQNIVTANRDLQHWLAPRRMKLEHELTTSEQRIRANRLLESREYPFCLFPRETLQNFLLDFSSHMP
ncbi:MAG: hypothetical protein GXP26_15725 [Planctomycetes bacterium]|nr:hypothetical protein [Planctomycetota bacterium]